MTRRDRDRDILWQTSGLPFLTWAEARRDMGRNEHIPGRGQGRSQPLRIVPAVATAPVRGVR